MINCLQGYMLILKQSTVQFVLESCSRSYITIISHQGSIMVALAYSTHSRGKPRISSLQLILLIYICADSRHMLVVTYIMTRQQAVLEKNWRVSSEVSIMLPSQRHRDCQRGHRFGMTILDKSKAKNAMYTTVYLLHGVREKKSCNHVLLTRQVLEDMVSKGRQEIK